ncbi:hypothetical protein P4283_28035 [Bacillus thuringiensis]|nr:hypothetical protein [Bacillus thuringiensis]
MDCQKLYRYLLNNDVMMILYQVGLKSKVVTYYKKETQEYYTFPNIPKRFFQPGNKDVPTVACNITEFPLVYGLKVYVYITLKLSTYGFLVIP